MTERPVSDPRSAVRMGHARARPHERGERTDRRLASRRRNTPDNEWSGTGAGAAVRRQVPLTGLSPWSSRFYQIENKMDAVLRYDLASTIPVVEEQAAAPAK